MIEKIKFYSSRNLIKIIMMFSFFIFSQANVFAADAKMQARNVEGDVAVIRDGALISLKEGAPIQAHDIIVSDLDSQTDIVWGEKWGYRLLGGSECQIAHVESGRYVIDMSLGNIILNVAELKENETLELQTPIAIAAVRGTQFWGRVLPLNEDSQTTIAVREGALVVTHRESGERVFISAGEAVDLDAKGIRPESRRAAKGEMQAMAQADEIFTHLDSP